MERYLFSSLNNSRRVLIGYDENGLLRELRIDGPLSQIEIEFLMQHFPWMESGLSDFERLTHGKVTRMKADLSFDAFWNSYAYKVGNKLRTEKLWNKLPDVDKATALKVIPIYDQFLMLKNNQDKVYPETFLSQRRFENSYKIL